MLSRKGLRLVAWVWLGMYICVLVTLTHLPTPPAVFKTSDDKTLHFLAYFVLGGLTFFTLGLTLDNKRALSIISIVFCLLFAAMDEITQTPFGRTADILDWRADAIGAIVSVTLMTLIQWIAILKAGKKSA